MAEAFAQFRHAHFPAVGHVIKPTSRLFPPSRPFLSEADQESGKLPALGLGKSGQSLLETEEGGGGHASKLGWTKAGSRRSGPGGGADLERKKDPALDKNRIARGGARQRLFDRNRIRHGDEHTSPPPPARTNTAGGRAGCTV